MQFLMSFGFTKISRNVKVSVIMVHIFTAISILLCLQLCKETQTKDQKSLIETCNKEEFDEKIINRDAVLDSHTIDFVKKKCLRNINRCKKASFHLTYMKNDHDNYFYFVSVDELKSKQRKDCWGYELLIQSPGKIQRFYIKTMNQIYTKYFPIKSHQRYRIALQTYPIFESVEINTIAPGDCENEVLQKIKYRIDLLGPVICKKPPSLLERTTLAEAICLTHPKSRPFRRYTISKSISTINCSITYNPNLLSSTMNEQNNKKKVSSSPLILIIPLVITSISLLVISVFITAKLCRETDVFTIKTRKPVGLLQRRQRHSHDENADVDQENDDSASNRSCVTLGINGVQTLVTEASFIRNYNSV